MNILLFHTCHADAIRSDHAALPGASALPETAPGHDLRIVAPVPRDDWPLRWLRRSAAARRLPGRASRDGIPVMHPRFRMPLLPGARPDPARIARAALPAVRHLLRTGFRPDVIHARDAHPDRDAALRIGRALGIPVACTTGNPVRNTPGPLAPGMPPGLAGEGRIT